MDTQNLKAFKEVAELKSFSLGAEKLHLTQPAISKRIKVLEEQVNAKLFDRIGKQVFLTEAGLCLLPRCKQILALMAESQQALVDLEGEIKGELKLITSHHIGLHRLPKVLQKYKKRYPAVKLNIQFKNSSETHQAILMGQGDLGITSKESLSTTKITSADVWLDKLAFIVARHHPLAKLKRVKLEDIARYPAILPDQAFYTTSLVSELFAKHQLNINYDNELSTNYLETIKALVSIGETWSVVPETMLDNRQVTVLKPKGGTLSRQLVYIRHQERSLNNACRAFIELLEEVGQ